MVSKTKELKKRYIWSMPRENFTSVMEAVSRRSRLYFQTRQLQHRLRRVVFGRIG